ncbi:GNAT family N-acetyltransferase [Verrucomicrobia bacterium S94]|nr:GNAT family N-acetyltransferase [Verrucomicrobia bacterium S94]
MKKTTIDPVTDRSSIAETAALAKEIWNEYFVPLIGQAQVDYMLGKFQSIETISAQIAAGTEYYLARTDDEPCGYLALIPNKPEGKLMLSKIYVKNATRGTGLGTALLEQTQKRASETGAQAVWLTVNRGNSESIAWYRRKGFIATDEVKKDIGSGFYMDDYIMELKLPPPCA